jgi:hypothetical protein
MYRHGRGTPVDKDAALEWYEAFSRKLRWLEFEYLHEPVISWIQNGSAA